MALSLGFRFKEIFKDVKHFLFGRSWDSSVKPKAGEWTTWLLMTPFEVPHCPRAPWNYPVTSCGTLACVLKTLAQKSWRSGLSSLIDLERLAHALEMIKREREKNKRNQNRKTKPLPSSCLAGSRPQATFFPLNPWGATYFPLCWIKLLTVVEIYDTEGIILADKCIVTCFSMWEINWVIRFIAIKVLTVFLIEAHIRCIAHDCL